MIAFYDRQGNIAELKPSGCFTARQVDGKLICICCRLEKGPEEGCQCGTYWDLYTDRCLEHCLCMGCVTRRSEQEGDNRRNRKDGQPTEKARQSMTVFYDRQGNIVEPNPSECLTARQVNGLLICICCHLEKGPGRECHCGTYWDLWTDCCIKHCPCMGCATRRSEQEDYERLRNQEFENRLRRILS